MAVARHSQFRKEFKEFYKLKKSSSPKKLSKLEKEILNRWDLDYPDLKSILVKPKYLSFDDSVGIPDIHEGVMMFDLHNNDMLKQNLLEITPETIDTINDPSGIDYFRYIKSEDKNIGSYYTGKYLFLKLDITQKKTHLKKSFDQIIDHFKKIVPESSEANKGFQLNPWTVYDLKTYYNLNLHQVAKKISGINAYAAIDQELNAVYSAVRRSYKSACEMIEQVGVNAPPF